MPNSKRSGSSISISLVGRCVTPARVSVDTLPLEFTLKNLIVTLSAACGMAIFAASASAAIDDAKAQEVMKKGGCVACHTVDKKLVGPSYKDVALKRKAEPDAVATLEKNVRAGSKGVFGPMPMMATPAAKISDADLHDLAEWILTK